MKTLDEFMPVWLRGNRAAIEFIRDFYAICELWDDLIDRDRIASPKEINGALYSALVTLPRNAFYVQNFARLSPIIESLIIEWYTANEMEGRKDIESLHSSFILRCSPHALTVMCANIIGGAEWATKVSVELRSLGETWAEYAAEHGVG